MQSKIEYVATNSIKTAKFQPASRTAETTLRKLKENIETAGGILVPLIVKDGTLADGHRRLAIAKQLGYETVPVVRVNGKLSLEETFSNVNTGSKPFTAKDAMQAVANGYPTELLGNRERHEIEQMIRVVGVNGQKRLAKNNRSSSIMACAASVANYCGRPDDEFRAKALNWLDEQDQQYLVRQSMLLQVPAKNVTKAIESNKPLSKKVSWA